MRAWALALACAADDDSPAEDTPTAMPTGTTSEATAADLAPDDGATTGADDATGSPPGEGDGTPAPPVFHAGLGKATVVSR